MNNMLKKIIQVIIASTILLGMLGSAYSVTGLNAILSSQNPDPVSPGNFVYVNVKISNTGTETVKDASLTVLENDVFRVAQGEDKKKFLGSIPSFSRGPNGDESGFVIVKYKIHVDEKAPVGLNTLTFELDSTVQKYTYDFDILVQDNNPKIQINSFDISKAEPGKTSKLTMEVENVNTITLKDIFVTLDLKSVTGEALSVLKGSNQKIIPTLNPSQKKEISFDLVVDPSADAKPYLLPVNLAFEDNLNNNYSSQIIGSVEVYSTPYLSVQLDSQDSHTVGKTKVTLAVANPGTSPIKGTQVEIMDSDKYEVIEGKHQYIGDLNPDDFQTMQSTIYINSEDTSSLKVKVNYLDSYNQVKEKIIDLPIKVFNKNELTKYGLSSNSNSTLGYTTVIVLIIIFGLVGFWYGGRRAKKKIKKN